MDEKRLTTRQHLLLTRLEQRMAVTDVSLDLDVTRNDVYQQMAALKRKCVLPHDFTASGRPPRSSGRTSHPSWSRCSTRWTPALASSNAWRYDCVRWRDNKPDIGAPEAGSSGPPTGRSDGSGKPLPEPSFANRLTTADRFGNVGKGWSEADPPAGRDSAAPRVAC